MEQWKDKHFRFNDIPEGIRANGEWTDIKKMDLSKIEYLIIWHHKSTTKDLCNLPEMLNLKYLEINWSNAISLYGIEKFKTLKRLELHCGTKLESIENICSLRENIEHIHFNKCKKINDHPKIICCNNLETLCFNECGKIEDINFLLSLPSLTNFRFVDTNVLDGNLEPLIKHEKIISVGFLNKRHYSHKDTAIEELLREKTS